MQNHTGLPLIETLASRIRSCCLGCDRGKLAVIAALAASFALLVAQSAYYYPFLADDALISLRYSSRLLEGQGLTWTDGQPVEGYSNLLWTLLVAVPGACGVDLIVAARLLGVACTASVSVAAVCWYLRRQPARAVALPLTLGVLFFSCSGPIAAWTIGGLEQPLFAALIAAAIPLAFAAIDDTRPHIKTLFCLSFVLGLLCLTRPDGPLFTVAVLAALTFARLFNRRTIPWREAVLIATLPVVCWAGQMLFRIGYYGSYVPNTALVKIAPSMQRFWEGLHYVARGLGSLAPWSYFALVALAVLTFRKESRGRAVLLGMMAGLWLVYIASVGGDLFPAFRHLVPVVAILMYAIIEATCFVWKMVLARSARWCGAYLVAVGLSTAYFVVGQFREPENRLAKTERWEWEGQIVGQLLKQAFSQQQPLVAVTAAGCLPYWSELPSLDMLGLNDDYLPRHPPAEFGHGMLAHDLGDAAYVLRRQPDLIVFGIGSREPILLCGQQLQQMPEFHREYTRVMFVSAPPKFVAAHVFVRRESPKIGLRRGRDEIELPGFLFNEEPAGYACLGPNGEPAVVVAADYPASIRVPGHFPPEPLAVAVQGVNADRVRVEIERSSDDTVVRLLATTTDAAFVEGVTLTTRRQPPATVAAHKRR